MNTEQLSQEQVRQLFDYDQLTGALTWKVAPKHNPHMFGREAGSVNARGYRRVSIHNTQFLVHRVIFLWMKGFMPAEIDHDNRICGDNRWSNLNAATKSKNNRNRPKQKNNKSGYVGVIWNKSEKKWQAQITVNGEDIHLGRFHNIEDAKCARLIAQNNFGFHQNHGRTHDKS